jgi:hypothetical protein
MPHTSAPRRQMETRASNKTAHPGYVDKVIPTRRSGVEVQKTRTAKAQAKAAREEAKKNSINRTAEFELADIAKENLADATPALFSLQKLVIEPTLTSPPSRRQAMLRRLLTSIKPRSCRPGLKCRPLEMTRQLKAMQQPFLP